MLQFVVCGSRPCGRTSQWIEKDTRSSAVPHLALWVAMPPLRFVILQVKRGEKKLLLNSAPMRCGACLLKWRPCGARLHRVNVYTGWPKK